MAASLLALFGALSFLDGVYLHLWRFRLQERPESRYEHLTHTWRAVLFIPILALLFLVDAGGWLLWTGIAFLLADLVVEIADARSERDSRSWQGGLTTGEYILHLVLTGVRVAGVTLALAAKPAAAWLLDAPLRLSTAPTALSLVAELMLPGAVLVAALHVLLVLRPMLLRELCAAWPVRYCSSR
ncbi:MAG TPA: hypothetical protein VF618_06450 [Thermoanaerobaculia bacterium]